jgi:hypothetical protein
MREINNLPGYVYIRELKSNENLKKYYNDTKDNNMLTIIAEHCIIRAHAATLIETFNLGENQALLQEFSAFNPVFIHEMDEDNINVFLEAMIDSIENITMKKRTFAMKTDYGIFFANFESGSFYMLNEQGIQAPLGYPYIHDFFELIINKINELYNASIPLNLSSEEIQCELKSLLEKCNDLEK